jgi:copper ion binding protein
LSPEDAEPEETAMSTRTYDVPGISCDHCKAAIETEVAKLPDVTGVEVDVEARTVTVEGSAPDRAIRSAIDDAGYDVAAVH